MRVCQEVSMAFRIFLSLQLSLFGLISLKIYHDRNKDNVWGNLYKTFGEMKNWRETAKYGSAFSGEIMLYLGWGAIIYGLCILLLGS